MPEHPDAALRLYLTTLLQCCFCGPKMKPLPLEPLHPHSYGCTAWDWAMLEKKVTPKHRAEQLDEYARELGDT